MRPDLLLQTKPDLLLRSAPHDPAPDHSGPWDHFAARVLASSLNRQLAAGRPQSSRALAIHARHIVSLAGRRELAQCWRYFLDLAVRPPVPLTPRGPVCRWAAATAERHVREVIALLACGLPIAARGAAPASWLLSNGTGPNYNHRSPLELSAAVREATRQTGSFADSPLDGADPDNSECYQ